MPWFSVERLIRANGTRAAAPDAPLATIEKGKGANRLAALDPTAQALGLTVGLGLADARVRAPDLLVFDHDPYADQRLLERIADGCVRYTPNVALDAPDGLVLDITGSAHLFGGEGGLATDVEDRLARAGFSVRHAVAYAPEAALALARYQRVPAADEYAAVRRLPIAALRLDTNDQTALQRAGLTTIGDVSSRPLSAIAARFGADAVAAIRRITGDAHSPLLTHQIVPPITFDLRFAEPIARTEYAIERLGDLAEQAVAELDARKRGGRRFDATFFRTDGLTQHLSVETGTPTRDVRAILRLFRERVDSLSDPLDPGFGYDMLRLAVPRHEPLGISQLKLEGGEAIARHEVDDLVDRLSTRVGRKRVRRFTAHATHIPEQAQLSLPALETSPEHPPEWPISTPDNPPMRPLHLFDPPQRIEVLAEVPDGPPHHFRWRRTSHQVTRFEGPERIASEWWRAKDGNPAHGAPTRDYYRVEDIRGRRFWIFRHGLYNGEVQHPGWYLHGLFA